MSDPIYTPYQSLQSAGDGENCIRLLVLAPGQFNDTIEITLRSCSITQDLYYEALSYVWGKGLCSTPAMVNGCLHKITHSLDAALRYLRYPDCNRVMWIDALSIDQANIQERNHQVQLMDSIYSRATRVIIWLGPAKRESDFVIDYLLGNDDGDARVPYFIYYALFLMDRPWFSRVWVVQEAALATDALIQCGYSSLSLHYFLRALRRARLECSRILRSFSGNIEGAHVHWTPFLRDVNPFNVSPEDLLHFGDPEQGERQTKKAAQTVIQIFLKHSEKVLELDALIAQILGQQVSLPHLYSLTAHRQATDCRDKVYSLMGIWNSFGEKLGESQSPRLLPDYSISTALVFTKLMALIISEGFRFGYPRFPLLRNDDGQILGLPSWVPDLTSGTSSTITSSTLSAGTRFRPYSPEPLCAAPEALEILIRPNADSDHNMQARQICFSQNWQVLFARGAALGRVIASRVLDTHIGADLDVPSILMHQEGRVRFILILQEFFKDRPVDSYTILKALLGPSKKYDTKFPAMLKLFDWLYRPHLHKLSEARSVSVDEFSELWIALSHSALKRTLFITNTGRVGLSIGELRDGDQVAGLFGINFPFVLRQIGGKRHSMINVAHIADHELEHESRNLCEMGYEMKDFTIV